MLWGRNLNPTRDALERGPAEGREGEAPAMGRAGGNVVSECSPTPVWTEVLPQECISGKALECSAFWRARAEERVGLQWKPWVCRQNWI